MRSVAIIGAGLSGSEAALVLARKGIPVTLYEARPSRMTPAHTTALPAELVCSNSFKSQELPTAHGLLKAELQLLGSPLLTAAKETAVSAGSALAVDREQFSLLVQKLLYETGNVTLVNQELVAPPEGHSYCIIAAGPLASAGLTTWLINEFSAEALNFYDAIAPIIAADSIDYTIAFKASRWQEGEGDYVNCPFSEDEYRHFYDALVDADRVTARDFEQEQFFEACLPVEVAAERGFQSLTFGPLRPIGLTDPRTGRWPFAAAQLRNETRGGESYNMVGFQTRLKIPEQQRIFRLIPGLKHAEFLRYGSIHRNTYLNAPLLLHADLSFRKRSTLFLAGQMCGNEGYTESIATGHYVARAIIARIEKKSFLPPPTCSALGALVYHVTASGEKKFTPSNIHFGLFPPLTTPFRRGRGGKREKKELLCERALSELAVWIGR